MHKTGFGAGSRNSGYFKKKEIHYEELGASQTVGRAGGETLSWASRNDFQLQESISRAVAFDKSGLWELRRLTLKSWSPRAHSYMSHDSVSAADATTLSWMLEPHSKGF